MSEEQEQAALGRMVQEYSTLKQKLATLQNEAARIGRDLEPFARHLQDDPENIDAVPSVQMDRIAALVKDIKETDTRKRTLQQQLVGLGLLDSRDMDVI